VEQKTAIAELMRPRAYRRVETDQPDEAVDREHVHDDAHPRLCMREEYELQEQDVADREERQEHQQKAQPARAVVREARRDRAPPSAEQEPHRRADDHELERDEPRQPRRQQRVERARDPRLERLGTGRDPAELANRDHHECDLEQDGRAHAHLPRERRAPEADALEQDDAGQEEA
jgi:hypothetical protein